jgi:3-oxoacyl-[acyl-carrier protein] reductase
MGQLDGQHVLVTGGSSGIGKACAQRYRAEGATVYVADIRPQSSDEIQLDVSDSAAWVALISSLPPLDMVHLNAGITTPGRSMSDDPTAPLSDVTDDAYRTIVGVNLDGVYFGARAVLPGMVEREFGRIVNITSAMVKTPHSPMALSHAARTGLTSVSKGLSRDVASANVTINNLLPERIDTGRQREMADLAVFFKGITLEQAYADIAATIAAGRLGRPEEVGDACAYLCSVQASFISGQSLQVDGGSYVGVW